ncbi:hypothetical protein AB1Y20_010656 [Prymnesium parvum]|uniref:Hexosyltransferase n=1 Tax=Prymnesium parvum TaxID=97485 RepID=A0AB34IQB3_PRYPA
MEWLAPSQRRWLRETEERIERFGPQSIRGAQHRLLAQGFGLLNFSAGEPKRLRDGGVLVLTANTTALPRAATPLAPVLHVPPKLLARMHRRATRTLTESELSRLASHHAAWRHATRAQWAFALLIAQPLPPHSVRRLTALLPSLVDAAALRDADWQLLLLSRVDSARFFRVVRPAHIPELAAAARLPRREAVGAPAGWDRVSPTLGCEAVVYRRALMKSLLAAFHDDRAPRLNPPDVWIFQHLAARGLLQHVLAPAGSTAVAEEGWVPWQRGRRAWVTLLTGNSVNYTAMALVQVRSVARFSRLAHHVTLITPNVKARARARLAAAGSTVREVPPVEWRHMPPEVGPHWRLVFTKLHLYNMTDYVQVAFLDADMFLADTMADKVFTCEKEVCAVRDHAVAPETGSFMINVGLLVVRPSAARFSELVRRMDGWVSPDVRLPEQEFLSDYYNVTRNGLSPLVGVLPRRFNSCRLTIKALLPGGRPSDLDAVYIVHHCAGFKLDRLPLCIWAPRRGAAPFCNSTHVRLFQRLYLKDHPCAVHSRNRPFCMADRRCQWCTGLVRCVARDTSCDMGSASTRAHANRVGGFTFGGQTAWKGDERDASVIEKVKGDPEL